MLQQWPPRTHAWPLPPSGADCRSVHGPDPQAGTNADTYSFEQYWDAMRVLLLDNSLVAAREA